LKSMPDDPVTRTHAPVQARRHIQIILNPIAGRRHRSLLDAVLARLGRAGCAVTLLSTHAPGDAERLARDILARIPTERPDLIVAAGGDGTIGEIVEGMLKSSAQKNDIPLGIIPLGIIPLGTANVLAGELGLPENAADLAYLLLSAPAKPIFVGRANGRCFTQMAGIGFDAHVVASVDPGLKRLIGKGAYLVAAFRQLRRFSFPRYRILIDGVAHEAASIILAKGRYYGGKHLLAPKAKLSDPSFQVCLFKRPGVWNILKYTLAMRLGFLPRLSGFRIIAGRSVRIDGPQGDPVQGDGDIIAHLPVEIGIAPDPLLVIGPANDQAAN